ncbi:DUF4339 domain-containing protein [bacterium]|nr:DUF4339 domain-containing protein [bacterium]
MEPKSQWYYENHGRAEGPISTLELVKKIQDGELQLLDLVFKEGDGQWLPAQDFSEITSLVKTTASQFKVDADWIVLRSVEVDGREQYDQIGPFAIEQILRLLDKGKIKFTDFVWRNGYENWVPLGRLDEFENPLESSVQVDLSIYEKPRQEELSSTAKNVKIYKAKIKEESSEEKPKEARGEDLAKPKWSVEPKPTPVKKPTPAVEVIRPAPPVQKPEKAVEPEESAEKQILREEKREVAKKRWSAVASAVAVFIFLSGAGLFIVYGQKAYQSFQRRSDKILFEPIQVAKKQPFVTQKSNRPLAPVQAPTTVTPPPQTVVAQPFKETVKPLEKINEEPEAQFSQMTEKQKSFFFHQERMHLFYSAQKGVKLIDEIDKFIKKPSKKKIQQKMFISSWFGQIQSLRRKVREENKNSHMFQDLFKRLDVVTLQLEERGRDLQAQLANGRGPSKEWTLKEVRLEYKKIMGQAKELD